MARATRLGLVTLTSGALPARARAARRRTARAGCPARQRAGLGQREDPRRARRRIPPGSLTELTLAPARRAAAVPAPPLEPCARRVRLEFSQLARSPAPHLPDNSRAGEDPAGSGHSHARIVATMPSSPQTPLTSTTSERKDTKAAWHGDLHSSDALSPFRGRPLAGPAACVGRMSSCPDTLGGVKWPAYPDSSLARGTL
jgi:hypothetical protein